ncbi:hypothetical protein [Dactylosporangium sp. NPDC005555]|uniref:hypothetical protein n=1 Tax=Dactylosporangium sp. NPDC005555 TaxID=3154889 RepID=UPI0033BE630B
MFRGRVWHTVFCGAPGDGWTGPPGRDSNEWRGNDFSDAELVDVDFRDIDLGAQRWPTDADEYALIDRVDERTAEATAAIRDAPAGSWPDPLLAAQAVDFVRTGRPRDPKGFVLIRRRELGHRLPPQVRDRLWALLVTAYSNDQEQAPAPR